GHVTWEPRPSDEFAFRLPSIDIDKLDPPPAEAPGNKGVGDKKPTTEKPVEPAAKPAPAQPTPQAAKTDRERMVGNWFIMNDDSQRKGEMWVITEDSILMHAKNGGANAYQYAHRLGASTSPKRIDITVTLVKGPTVGIIKGIYVLDGELRLCLAS